MQKALGLISIIFTLLVCAFLVFLNYRIFKQKAILAGELELWQEQLDRTNQQNQELYEKLSEFQTTAYLEKVARENLNLKKSGEKVVVFIEEQEDIVLPAEKKETFWQKLKKIFGF